MSWSAIIPLNLGGACKTRLSLSLSTGERRGLVESVAGHVVREARSVAAVTRVVILSPIKPPFPNEEWIADQGRGLNAELEAAARTVGNQRVLFLHADLPFVSAADIARMIEGAETAGAAIAPDHIGEGTNALALVDADGFTPLFGIGSQAAHRGVLPHAHIVECDGLAFDLDTQSDLERAMARGFSCTLG